LTAIRTDLRSNVGPAIGFTPTPDRSQNSREPFLMIAQHQHFPVDIFEFFVCVFDLVDRSNQSRTVLTCSAVNQYRLLRRIGYHVKDLIDQTQILIFPSIHREIIVSQSQFLSQFLFNALFFFILTQVDDCF